MKKSILVSALLTASISSSVAAAELDIQITNLTQGIFFTPLLITAHNSDTALFSVGTEASGELQAMAEGGDISGLAGVATSAGANNLENPAAGLLVAGASATGSLSTDDTNTHLSVVAMLLPTNDGFVGLNSWEIPTEPGTYEVYLNGYDAGTEANDEMRGSGAPGEAGFPVPPPLDDMLGQGASGITGDAEGNVHIHRGNLGDSDTAGGMSDINSTTQRWLNPVAKLVVTVN